MRAEIIIWLLAVMAALTGQSSPTNSITRSEAAEGWLLLFDGESSYGWTSNHEEKLRVKEGIMHLTGPGTMQTTTAFCSYALQFTCRVTGANSHDAVRLGFGGTKVNIAIPKDKNPAWSKVKLMVVGPRYSFKLTNGSDEFPAVEGKISHAAATPLEFSVAAGVHLELRDITLLPLGNKALFNGKNLEGWRQFQGMKYVSQFSVNDRLEMNVKNGPGDLQTEGLFADFLLQLDCISHGKFLNSGIFFRCKPNEYQNGYECQIRNQFTPEAKQKYTIDHYDPITRQLKEKKTIFSTAVDFGTGAIYRRMPARKQVAKDQEWFTLTIVAHGNHFATWVDGVQVCDWTDNRLERDNPREGCRLDAGSISIQGHDPTTDLSFRSIRIAEYPAPTEKKK